ncbi:hypothetical protein SISNIDRAFT_485532 [Sistotremastrum niveocremeum HHB9708]|uniref:Ubiquitin-like domain-containing protein n=1 Tax=Sistotremastrum niveocremeum HHB9708 TaxID=1314777 RepID=A0A164UIB3_9AGAM|nr:hypothetical protein SISNIDRAFT_485532 [Sistotremastrum niveocremeum HHB9708]
MRISVQTFLGKTLVLDNVSPSTKISDLKKKVQEQMNIKRPITSLTLDGVELQNNRPVSHYSYQDGVTIHVGTPDINLSRITFHVSDGTSFAIEVNPRHTVGQIKKTIAAEEGIVPKLQTLLLRDTELEDAKMICEYPLDGQALTLELSHSYQIFVKIDADLYPVVCRPFDRVANVRDYMQLDPNIPDPRDLAFYQNGEELNEHATLEQSEVEPGTILRLAPPKLFHINIRTFGLENDRSFNLRIETGDHVLQLKTKIQDITGIEVAQQKLVCNGRRVLGDEPVRDYGIITGTTVVMAVDIPIVVKTWFKSFDDLTFDPFSRLSDLRRRIELEEKMSLEHYRFSIDGKGLSDSSSLWDHGLRPHDVLYLGSRVLTLNVRTMKGVTFEVEVEELATVPNLKAKVAVATGIPVEQQNLIIFGKIRSNDKTLKDHGLRGGETVYLGARPSTRDYHSYSSSLELEEETETELA